MRVALDVTPALAGVTGVARYTLALTQALPSQQVDVRPFAIGRGRGSIPLGTRRVRLPLRLVQMGWRLGLPPWAEHLAAAPDLVHSCDLVPPPTRRPLVATVHDLAALERPDLHPARAVVQARARLEALGRVAAVFPNSQATASALARHGIGGERVIVVPLAAGPRPTSSASKPSALPYLLAVGEVAARKDYPTLLRAFATGAAGQHRLVIVGPTGFRGEEVYDLAARLDLGDRVRFTGHVSDGTLASLYAGATALCFPSLAEGFGMPLVEAMQAELPIVASDIDATREVAADAALLFPAGDAAALAEALQRITTEADLRDRLTTVGRSRASLFTWERTVAATVAGYQKVLGCE
jgi:glycosyltransferase involved in cell wall biosynthesis